jgi:hypothetical protein
MGVPQPPSNFYISPAAMPAMNGHGPRARALMRFIEEEFHIEEDAHGVEDDDHKSLMINYDVASYLAIGHPKKVRFADQRTEAFDRAQDQHSIEPGLDLWGDPKGLDFGPVLRVGENGSPVSSPKQARTESEEAGMMAAVRDVCLHLYETCAPLGSGIPVGVTFSNCPETSDLFVSVSFNKLLCLMLDENVFWDSSPKRACTESEEAAMMSAVRDVCAHLYGTCAALCSGIPVGVTFFECPETSDILVSVSFNKHRDVDVATAGDQSSRAPATLGQDQCWGCLSGCKDSRRPMKPEDWLCEGCLKRQPVLVF